MNEDADELPEGWTTANLPDICQINPAKPKSSELAPDLPVTFVPMQAVDADEGAITRPLVRTFDEVRKGFTSFRENDVIMAKITPCMENGKAAIARGLQNGLGFGSTEFHVLRSEGAVLPDYVFHFIRQESFRKLAEQEMSGSVGQKRVPAEFPHSLKSPFPHSPSRIASSRRSRRCWPR
jgi:type I restriction enzyme, S subunit